MRTVELALVRRCLTGILVALTIGGAAAAAPLVPPTDRPVPTTDPPPAVLRVLSYNIRHGVGTDNALDLERVARVIAAQQPDLVLLQEVDERVRRSGGVDQAAWLGERLGLHHAFAPFMDLQGGRYGLAILSRAPIDEATVIPLPPGRHEPRAALMVTTRSVANGLSLRAVCVHFDWLDDDTHRTAQATALTAALETVPGPIVLGGDFNDVPGSATMQHFSADWRVAAPTDVAPTWPATAPDRCIDFVLLGGSTALTGRSGRVVDERLASDHRPVLAVVEIAGRPARPPASVPATGDAPAQGTESDSPR